MQLPFVEHQADPRSDSCSSLASFMSALLEEKIQGSGGSTSFDNVTVEILDDNVKHKSRLHQNRPQAKNMITVRRKYSTRQQCRWTSTFEPNNSAPDLMLAYRKNDLQRASSMDALQVPQRKDSPRLVFRTLGTEKKIMPPTNATWSHVDVLNTNQRSMRLTTLFDSTLTLSPEENVSQSCTDKVINPYNKELFIKNILVQCNEEV
jgi:hypothetical protein